MIAIILAGGKSERMNSSVSKVLLPLYGHPMLFYILSIAKRLAPNKILIVIGRDSEEIRDLFGKEKVEFVEQPKPLGTADAVLRCKDYLRNPEEDVVILCGDVPLLSSKTLKNLLETYYREKADAALLTAEVENPNGYGRVVRKKTGEVIGIVEEREATEEIKEIKEINSGIYVFKSKFLLNTLERIMPSKRTGEYYLTDAIAEIIKDKGRVISVITPDPMEIRGVNTPEELAFVREVMKERWGPSKK